MGSLSIYYLQWEQVRILAGYMPANELQCKSAHARRPILNSTTPDDAAWPDALVKNYSGKIKRTPGNKIYVRLLR